MKELQPKINDKIEIVKQQQKKQTLVLQNKIRPKRNHLMWEYNFKDKTLELAKYEPHRTDLYWFEAVQMHQHKISKKIDLNNADTITKEKVIKKENCIYFMALNRENAIKYINKTL